jgi:hypothetical protein
MTNKGKHSGQASGTFYRDLAIMILGILLVGAAVFFVLYLFADEPATGPTVTTTTTTTTLASSTSQDLVTTTGDGATTTSVATTSTSPVDVRPPSEVTVVVLNSMGADGAASRFNSQLAEAGYQTLTPDNFTPEQDPSRVWYREGYAAEAASLASEFLPGATVEPLPDETLQEGADVVVVLGTGYTE